MKTKKREHTQHRHAPVAGAPAPDHGQQAGRRPALRDLSFEHACFAETGNPIHAWHALWFCLQHGLELPPWVREVFIRAAGAFRALGTTDKFSDEEKLEKILGLLHLRPRDRLFAQFSALRSGLEIDTFERIAIERLRMKQAARFTYKGPKHNQKTLKAAAAKNVGMSARTYDQRLALAKRVQARVATFAKDQTE